MLAARRVHVFVSHLTCPWSNLALEDLLFRSAHPESYILFLFRNDRCVVVGRNQNPFVECRLNAMRDLNIQLVRRQSGGGTVYHDLGNVNYSIHMPRSEFSLSANAELIARAVRQMDIPAEVTKRNDVAVNGYKVSGSAYRLISKRAFHHGTMLVNANLDLMRKCLKKEPHKGLICRSIKSVPSPVKNLADLSLTACTSQFMNAVIHEFHRVHFKTTSAVDVEEPPSDLSITEFKYATLGQEWRSYITAKTNEWKSWEWQFAQTPKFQLKFDILTESVQLSIDRGLFHEVQCPHVELKNMLEQFLLGQRFDINHLQSRAKDDVNCSSPENRMVIDIVLKRIEEIIA